MAGFSIMLFNFIFMPLLIIIGVVIALAGTALLFGLGGLAAVGVIRLGRRMAGRHNDRTLYVRAGDAKQTAAFLRGAGAREVRAMSPGGTGPALVQSKISVETDLEGLMSRIAALPGVQGMYAE